MKLHAIFIITALILLAYSHHDSPAQESAGRKCPFISVSCPEFPSTGRTYICKANIQGGDPSMTPTFKWTVAALGGKITGGQGTPEVSFVAASDDLITVTAEVIGYPASCQNRASVSWVNDRPSSRKFDEYGSLKFIEERLRLAQFATQLQSEPKAKGYILIYATERSRADDARRRGERAKTYLIKGGRLKESQIVVVDGGYREKFTVELFVVPEGAPPPQATPTNSP